MEVRASSKYKAFAEWHTIVFSEGLTPLDEKWDTRLQQLFTIDPTPGITTGVALGPVLFTVEWLPVQPEEPSARWEDVIDLSARVDSHMVIQGPADDPAYDADVTAGTYRLRVCGEGRGNLYDQAATTPVEEYSLQFWPAPYDAPRLLRARSSAMSDVPPTQIERGGATGGE